MNVARRPLTLCLFALGLLAMLALASSASAGRYVEIEGAKAAGPAELDKVYVEKHGPRKAKNVLVLIPGTGGGAGSVSQISRDLSREVGRLQVWAFDRRSQAFEDTSGFAGGDPEAAADYYLGFDYDRVVGSDVPFVAKWGFNTELRDLRRVVRKAGRGDRKVILGGHSRGASSAVAYAAWDFGGRAGYRTIDGLVLIDGGLAAFGPQELSKADAERRLAEIRDGDVFNDALGAGIPEIGPIFAQLAALYARERPEQRSQLQDNSLVQAAGLAPDFPVTNAGFLGFVFDKTYSRVGGALWIRAGKLAPSGSPRGWESGENTPIEVFAKAFGRDPANATEWYYPNRMILDTGAANALGRTPAARLLRLRLFHTERMDVPLYAFQTDLTDGGVLEGANEVLDRSRIRRSKLVDASRGTSHLDPVSAPLASNRFTQTVIPFLERIIRKR